LPLGRSSDPTTLGALLGGRSEGSPGPMPGRRGCDHRGLQPTHPSTCDGVAWAPCSTRRRPASLGLARDRQAVTSGTGGCDNASQDQTYQQPGPAKPVGIARDIGRHEGAACQRSFR
jgi:hypothetical protein